MKKPCEDLLDIFQVALLSVNGHAVVKKELEEFIYPDEFHVIAIGKAADSMCQGIPTERIKTALVISKHGHFTEKLQQDSRIICIESDHPVPKKNSVYAGKALLQFLKGLPENEPCLFLISGGASALVEVLEDDWSLQQLQALTDYLLANAYPINEINAIRQRLSKIKGGGLWSYIGKRSVYCLIISDVPDDNPEFIGSGLLFPSKQNTVVKLPEKWQSKFKPFSNEVHFVEGREDFHWKIIASLAIAKEAAAIRAKELAYQIRIVPEFLQSEASKAAIDCVTLMNKELNTLFIWGGETTVYLPKNAGMGGRNQHLALAAAIEMKEGNDSALLAAGTDGTDGLTTATGAIVDNQTVKRGVNQGLKAADYLKRADSHSFFQKTDGLIVTGATGTNVMDLVLGISGYDPDR